MGDEKIKTSNDQFVGLQGDDVVVMMPRRKITKTEALRHAAWLVVMAEETDGEFERVLTAVKNT